MNLIAHGVSIVETTSLLSLDQASALWLCACLLAVALPMALLSLCFIQRSKFTATEALAIGVWAPFAAWGFVILTLLWFS